MSNNITEVSVVGHVAKRKSNRCLTHPRFASGGCDSRNQCVNACMGL